MTLTVAERSFIATITPAAQASQKLTNIPWQFVVAEACEETGYGVHAPGMNLFGVKKGVGWTGPVRKLVTREVIKGQDVFITDYFRVYTDWQGSIIDHAQFLIKNPRYEKAGCFDTTDPSEFCRRVAAAGYATDPHYAEAIIAVMHSAGLI